jgi:signal transduction histidine kinase
LVYDGYSFKVKVIVIGKDKMTKSSRRNFLKTSVVATIVPTSDQSFATNTMEVRKIAPPNLDGAYLGQQILLAVDYLKTRFSSKVVFNINMPNTPILVMINPPLFGWTFENLIKNAIDAMKGQGKISIELINKEKEVEIYITDTGKGIEQSHFKKIFEPGFTTKKRGWGLGLSLTKRIIEEYHNGKIKVEKSEMNVGTTFKIVFKQIDILLDF